MALGYGKGRLTCFLGDPEAVYDVVNSLNTLQNLNIHLQIHFLEELINDLVKKL